MTKRELNPACCEHGRRWLEELGNDQHADPGYRHIRIQVTSRGMAPYLRIRFCPWCGTKFLANVMECVSEFASVQSWLQAALAGARIPTAGGAPPPPRSNIEGHDGFWVRHPDTGRNNMFVFVPDKIAASDTSGNYLPGQQSP